MKKTRLCKYFKVGCTNKNCKFAHSKEELKPPMCFEGTNCCRRVCFYYHDGDTMPSQEDLYEYALQRDDFIKYEPFIVSIEEKDEESEDDEQPGYKTYTPPIDKLG